MSFKSSFRIIGLMSGTSLDGLDVVDIVLSRVDSGCWNFSIQGSRHFSYTQEWQTKLQNAMQLSGQELCALSHQIGVFFGSCVNLYCSEKKLDKRLIDAVASHGHTVFHQPHQGITLQIGNGPEISILTGLLSVVDFRVKDVLLGGNGAPLVPIGDQFLFMERAQSFLNLGGFSNISFRHNGQVVAFDICPVNVVLNKVAQHFGKTFDFQGVLGRSGSVNTDLLQKLDGLSYYQQTFPKSLGVEWVAEHIDPLVTCDAVFMRTFYEHIARQISDVLNDNQLKSVFVTGGGAKNLFLLERISHFFAGELIVPNTEIIDFKEAIVFALLGALRLNNETNVLASVTGAQRDSCSGVIHTPL